MKPTPSHRIVITAVQVVLALTLLVFARESVRAAVIEIGTSDAPQGWPGLGLIVGIAMAGSGVRLALSVVRGKHAAFFREAMGAFGVSWLVGVLVASVVAMSRRGPIAADLWTQLIDVISWIFVLVLLGTPGLVAVLATRRC